MTQPKTGLMICGHGSRDAGAVAEFVRLVDGIRERLSGHWPVAHGYLEFARPIIREGLDSLREEGCERILAVPGLLFAAGHAKNDMPSVLNAYASEHGVEVRYGRELGITSKLLRVAVERIEAAENASPRAISRHDTLLLVVGRGSSDPDANANVAKVARLLGESLGVGWSMPAYSGVTFPLTAPALERAARLGFSRVIVFPWFLFTGILVNRIYQAVDEAKAAYPHIEFLKASYLNDHPLVVETFLERARELVSGSPAMNCALCKYREKLPAFEHQVGEPQVSHHHHVEGIGTGIDEHHHDHQHAHSHPHTHGHDHHHHHAPYPHADHPLGPRTLDNPPVGKEKPGEKGESAVKRGGSS